MRGREWERNDAHQHVNGVGGPFLVLGQRAPNFGQCCRDESTEIWPPTTIRASPKWFQLVAVNEHFPLTFNFKGGYLPRCTGGLYARAAIATTVALLVLASICVAQETESAYCPTAIRTRVVCEYGACRQSVYLGICGGGYSQLEQCVESFVPRSAVVPNFPTW